MPKRSLFPFIAAVLACVCFPAHTMAEESLSTLTQDITAFIKGPDGRFAPETAAHAQAILGAALMAEKKHDIKSQNESILAAGEALASARKLARDFKSRFRDVLALETAAMETAKSSPDPEFIVAGERLHALIQAFEHGDLNQAVKLADSAKTDFKAIMDKRLPALLNKTDAALVAAARNGAKRYAPITYAAGKKWLSSALSYSDGVSKQWPAHPRFGLKLAKAARELASRVKQWRKNAGSFESLLVQNRRIRMEIARALDMDVNMEDPTADVDASLILQRIGTLKAGLEREHLAHKADVTRLKEAQSRQIEARLTRLRDEMTRQQSEQVNELKEAFNIKLGRIKEAFHTKLEHETFERKRQSQLRKIFHKDEVKILANLDGSLLIRLAALRFASGSSAIKPKYFDLLSRIKKGLELYPDREISIEGHTDNKGDPRANQKLSLKRAEAVRDFLVASGVQGVKFKALGYGDAFPIASNDYERGRAMNRRIDIIIRAASKH